MFVYDRREWSVLVFVSVFAGVILSLFIIYMERGESAFSMIQNSVLFFPSIFLVCLLVFAARGSIRIALSQRELKVQVGYFPFARRTILLDDLVRIERTEIPWYKAKTVKGWFVKTERYTASYGKAFLLRVKDGKPCIIQSRNREEILSTIKRVRSEVEII